MVAVAVAVAELVDKPSPSPRHRKVLDLVRKANALQKMAGPFGDEALDSDVRRMAAIALGMVAVVCAWSPLAGAWSPLFSASLSSFAHLCHWPALRRCCSALRAAIQDFAQLSRASSLLSNAARRCPGLCAVVQRFVVAV
jgi:hypothetical protein